MGGTFNNRRTQILKTRASKLDAKGRVLVARGRKLLEEARALRAKANRIAVPSSAVYRPSAALRSALKSKKRLTTKADFIREFRKQIAAADGNVTTLATRMDTHRVQVRRWAEALGISMEHYR